MTAAFRRRKGSKKRTKLHVQYQSMESFNFYQSAYSQKMPSGRKLYGSARAEFLKPLSILFKGTYTCKNLCVTWSTYRCWYITHIFPRNCDRRILSQVCPKLEGPAVIIISYFLFQGEEVLTVTAQDGDRGVPIPNAIMYSIGKFASKWRSL